MTGGVSVARFSYTLRNLYGGWGSFLTDGGVPVAEVAAILKILVIIRV